jgi:hypothetical protein
MRKIGAIALALALVACAESPRDSLEKARKALGETRYAEAILAADAGLAKSPDHITSWGLEVVKLEALARAGRGEETLAQIDALTAAWPDNMLADQFAATADQLRGAGQGAAAIQVLDRGLKRFPDDQALRGLIERAKTAPEPGSEELKMLESLGYINK